ncbi:hypothetical protein FBU59_001578 [Linderina macrospora]|uniref:Uncharacterized protein n=1 Tax=Linderina macrospora TaxID=4868 RepID=A0ACC1JDQ7_9FUNG|nr:hypothetical protein FBU59_001578 [Linderina macrospora]
MVTTRGSASESAVPATPPAQTGEAASSRASPISHRLRSRDRSGASAESDTTAEFLSPTQQLQKRNGLRSEDADEAAATTPARRSTRSSAAKKTTADDDVAEAADETPTSRRARRTSTRRSASNTSAGSSGDNPLTPTRRTTRSTSRTPAKKAEPKTSADTSVSEVAPVSPPPRTRRAGRQTRKQPAAEDSAGDGDVEMSEEATTPHTQDAPAVELPPPHPDLSGISSKLAAAAAVLDRSLSADGHSVDEGSFHTAPESPEKKLKEAEDKNNEDISDLSDVADPHFSDAPDVPETVPKGKHKTFGSDAEDDDDEDDAPEALPARQPEIAADEESDDDDDAAPEIVSAKKPQAEEAEESTPADAGEQIAKKKHRRRHRKHAAPAAVSEAIATAIETVAESLTKPTHVLPSEIPAELRLDPAKPARTGASAAPKRPAAGQKLDASLLADFAKESSGQHTRVFDDAPRKKRKQCNKTRSAEPARKGERLVSGIRVVAAAPASRMSLLESLTQEVPKSVKRFYKERHGGRRVPRSDPLEGIARGHGKPAVAFLKK